MTPVQSKMARAALGWSMRDLARQARVGLMTVTRFETGQSTPITATLAAMRRALEEAGIEFLHETGVQLRRSPGEASE